MDIRRYIMQVIDQERKEESRFQGQLQVN